MLTVFRQISSESGVADGEDHTGIGTQVAMVGATLPSSLNQILGDVVPVSIRQILQKTSQQ